MARYDDVLDTRLGMSKVAGIMVLLLFAVAKPDFLSKAIVESEAVTRRGWFYVAMNIAILLGGFSFARYAYLRTLEIQLRSSRND